MATKYKQKLEGGQFTRSEAENWQGKTFGSKQKVGWRPGQGKWGPIFGQSGKSKRRERKFVQSRQDVEQQAKDIGREQFEYDADPLNTGYQGEGLAKGFFEDYDLDSAKTELQGSKEALNMKMQDYLGEGTTGSGAFEDIMYDPKALQEFMGSDNSQLRGYLEEGGKGQELGEERTSSLDDLRTKLESQLSGDLDISKGMSQLEQNRISSGLAYHGGLESQSRSMDRGQEDIQRQIGQGYSSSVSDAHREYESGIDDLLRDFGSDVVTPWQSSMQDYADTTGEGAEEYRNYYGRGQDAQGQITNKLGQYGEAFQTHRDKDWRGRRGPNDWALINKEEYTGGAVGDILSMADYESTRRKKDIQGAFPTVEQILGG